MGCFVIVGIWCRFWNGKPLLNTLVTQVAPRETMGSVVSLFNTMKYVGQTAAPAVLGVILLNSNLVTVFISSSLLGFSVVVFTYIMRYRFVVET